MVGAFQVDSGYLLSVSKRIREAVPLLGIRNFNWLVCNFEFIISKQNKKKKNNEHPIKLN